MKIEAIKMIASDIWLTGLEGKGFTSTSSSEPCEDSRSSECQPGKVRRRRRQMNANTIATMLGAVSGSIVWRNVLWAAYIKYGKTIMSLN